MKPIITERPSGYLFTWESEKLSIFVNRIHVHIDGRVTGEVLICSASEGNKPIFPQTSLNFTSEQTRTRLIKTLESQDSRWKWQEIINQLSLAITERARLGEPVKELWTSEDIPPPKWLLKPFLYERLPTIMFGGKAVCKSTLALTIYACLILPWVDNPLGWEAPDHSIISLLADYEVDYDVSQYNAKRLQEGMGLPPFPLYHRRCLLPLADDIEQLSHHIKTLSAEVLIVDSLGPAVGGDLKDPGQALRFTTALRRLNCSTLIIGQTSKDRESKVKSTFGSVFFEYYARNIFELRKVQEEGEDSLEIAVYNTYHNLGKKFKAQGFHLNFDSNRTYIKRCPITAQELVDRMGTQEMIKHLLLQEGIMSVKDIADTLNLTECNVRVVISRLKSKGMVTKIGNNYGMLEQEKLIE